MLLRLLKSSANGFVKVFRNEKYIFCSLFFSLAILYIINLIPNWQFAKFIFYYNNSFLDKLLLLLEIFNSMWYNFMPLALFTTILISVLFGINLSIIIYYLKYYNSKINTNNNRKSFLSMMIALLGVGCASCGALFLAPIIGTTVVGITYTFLPFHGLELSITGIVVLLWSITSLLNKINNPYE